MKARIVLALVTAAILALPHSSEAATAKKRTGGLQVGGGIGFGVSPFDFSLGLDADYFITEDLSIGPRFGYILGGQAWMDEDIYLLMLDAKYGVDLNKGKGTPIRAFLSGGAGLGLIDWGGFGFGDLDPAFTIEFGAGVDIYATDNLVVGTQANFIFPIPGPEVAQSSGVDEDFIFQWNIVTARFLLP